MSRWCVSLFVALVALLILVAPVSASRVWCARDPIVLLNGTPVQIWVAIPEEYQSAVNGPVDVTVKIPEGIAHETIFIDEGFNGHGEVVDFEMARNLRISDDGSFDAHVKVAVPVDVAALARTGAITEAIPLQVTVVANGDLVRGEAESLSVTGGDQWVVEGLSSGVRVTVPVHGTP